MKRGDTLGKLLDAALSQHRLRLERYEQDLREFEERYDMKSKSFYKRFEAGELGDRMDFFEWAGLYELREDIVEVLAIIAAEATDRDESGCD